MEKARSLTVPAEAQLTSSMRLRERLRKLRKSYLFRVLVQGIVTIWAVMTFTFILIRQLPGNPVDIKIEQIIQTQNISYDEAEAQAALLFDFDPDAPLLEQYADYVGKLIRGDMGESITSRTPVIDLILRFLPWTLFSVGLGLTISFVLGIVIGTAMAYWRGSAFDNVMTAFASIMYGIPDFIIALLLLLVAGVQLQLFRVGDVLGGVDPNLQPGFNPEYIISLFQHVTLPVITYVTTTIGGWILTMKSSTLSTLGEDYITVAQARGLSQQRILVSYVGRNAMLPLVTRLAISIGFVISGSVIIETLFIYPGLGRLLIKSITDRDYTTMQGVFLTIAIAVIVSNILADLMYGWLDPRVRLGDNT